MTNGTEITHRAMGLHRFGIQWWRKQTWRKRGTSRLLLRDLDRTRGVGRGVDIGSIGTEEQEDRMRGSTRGIVEGPSFSVQVFLERSSLSLLGRLTYEAPNLLLTNARVRVYDNNGLRRVAFTSFTDTKA